MQVIDPGHSYLLDVLDPGPGQNNFENLTFVKREGEGYPGNVSHYGGTTIQEVLRALIERTQYLDRQIADWRNGHVVMHLRMCIALLEERAAERHGRESPMGQLPWQEPVELMPTCPHCLHVGCDGGCR